MSSVSSKMRQMALMSIFVAGFWIAGVTASGEVDLPRYITYSSGNRVRQCEDALSYLCGATAEDRCVSPTSFCDGTADCDSAWDEQHCDPGLPKYSETNRTMLNSKQYWMALSKLGCAKLCDNTPQCEGFSFHEHYKRCQLHTGVGNTTELGSAWLSYRRDTVATETRAARHLLDLPPANGETSNGDSGKLTRSGHQGRHLSRQARSVKCGQQPVFYNPAKKGRTGRVVGGSSVPYGAFPWQAELKLLDSDGLRQHMCGGALVSEKHVVTAAHCLHGLKKEEVLVVLGDHDLSARDEEELTYVVDKIIMHPGYDKLSKRHDLAVLKLRGPPGKKTYNGRVRPVCLPAAFKQPVDGTECVVTGWGLTDPADDASLSDTLKAARVEVIGAKQCGSSKVYGTKKRYFPEGTLCAGYLEGGADACRGDSGGPLACKIDGQFQLLGVVSWGDYCAAPNKPGVYTKVAQYVDWIASKLKE